MQKSHETLKIVQCESGIERGALQRSGEYRGVAMQRRKSGDKVNGNMGHGWTKKA